jgi:hypothetical protein
LVKNEKHTCRYSIFTKLTNRKTLSKSLDTSHRWSTGTTGARGLAFFMEAKTSILEGSVGAGIIRNTGAAITRAAITKERLSNTQHIVSIRASTIGNELDGAGTGCPDSVGVIIQS